MKWILTVALLQLTVVFAVDYVCPDGKSKKSITIKKDQSFLFDIAPGYGAKSKCGVVYKPQKKGKTRCKKIKFSCTTFDLPNKSGPPKCKKGDKLKVGKQFFCKTKAPEVESTKPIKLMFLSDKKDSSGVATCSVMCADSATTTPPPSPTTAGLLIVGGSQGQTKLSSVELFNLDSKTSCMLPSLPEHRRDHTLDGNLTCGGNSAALGGSFSDCLSLTDSGTWEVTHSLFPYSRRQHSSWEVDQGVVLIGTYSTWNSDDWPAGETADLVRKDGWSEHAFDLDHRTYSACSIPLETSVSSVIVTGGWWSGYAKKVTQYTWSQGLESFSVNLPELLEDRAYHGCGKYMDSNNKNVLLVTGGVLGAGSDALATTELLTIGDSSWRLVGSLPVAMTGIYHAAVSLDNTVLITGGYLHSTTSSGPTTDEIFSFDTATEEWKVFGNMKTARAFHAVSLANFNDYSNFCN